MISLTKLNNRAGTISSKKMIELDETSSFESVGGAKKMPQRTPVKTKITSSQDPVRFHETASLGAFRILRMRLVLCAS